jgi:Na+/H+ antiporter NhaC
VSEDSPSLSPLRIGIAMLIPLVIFVLPESQPVAGENGLESADRVTLLPPLFAIALAFATRRTLIPLVGGVWIGATMIAWREGGGWLSPVTALWDTFWTYVIKTSVVDPGGDGVQSFNLSVIGFVFALVAMVAITIRAGGMAGVAKRFQLLARSARATRVATWSMGLAIFFDDYANTLIVGGSMRPLTDRMRVSREKLAWIVDSTAAPVAGLSILSTWVAFEISQFAPHLGAIDLSPEAGYTVFVRTLPYRFYCLLTIFFVGMMCVVGRDFGPMLKAERRALRTGAVFRPGARPMGAHKTVDAEPKPGVPHQARLAMVPVVATLVAIVVLFLSEGLAGEPLFGQPWSLDRLRTVLSGVENNTQHLFMASMLGFMVAFTLATTLRRLTVGEALGAAVAGSRAMFLAVGILLMAWAISRVCGELGTRTYMAGIAPLIPGWALPLGLFLLSCAVSFATGSSWSTMGILLPIVIDLAANVGGGTSLGAEGMVIVCIGAVLDGAIFGDHCSPISDTTILSSTAAGSDHMDHVATQVPYAVSVMLVALLAGYLPAALGVPPAVSLSVGVVALVALAFGLGRRIEGARGVA